MNNIFRSDLVLEMLNAFGRVLNQLEIDFFLVGALALPTKGRPLNCSTNRS